MTISYRSSDPELAWTIARELSDLVVGSTLAGQKAALEQEQAAAATALKRATDELTRDGLPGIGALGVHHDLRVRRRLAWGCGRRLPRRDAQREIGLQNRNHDMRLTV